jgi:CubicO group peptidase (beta-lactamase class C family)
MKKWKYLRFSPFLAVILIAGPGSLRADQELFRSPYSRAISEYESFLKVKMELDMVPGLSVGFIKDDIMWVKGFGFSDLENRVPAKPDSAYRLASITKTITALAVLQLVEAGKIDLDAEVQSYVPYFPRKKWPVTIRHLLGHLGGISHYRNFQKEGHIKTHKNTRQALAIFKDFDLVAEPGTKYNYSSYGYNLLGAVVEGASGLPYGDYINRYIFKPLGMTDTRLDDPTDLIPNRVRGYRILNGEIKNSEFIDISSRFAGGGTRSTVVDLLRYAKGILEGRLLKKDTWKKMFTSMTTKSRRYTFYGMGWSLGSRRGHYLIHHGGSQAETKTYIALFPDKNFALAFATNREGLDQRPYAWKLAELILDEDLDRSAYVHDQKKGILFSYCRSVFSYGLSRYLWEGGPGISRREAAETFAFFREHMNLSALDRDFGRTKKILGSGFHPVQGEPLLKAGAYMAKILSDTFGREALISYNKTGPLAFFADYIALTRRNREGKRLLPFDNSFVRIIEEWQEDWKRVYPPEIENLQIGPATDLEKLSSRLSDLFGNSEIYPDLSQDLLSVSGFFASGNRRESALQALDICAALYSFNARVMEATGDGYRGLKEYKKALTVFSRAAELEPENKILQSKLKFIRKKVGQSSVPVSILPGRFQVSSPSFTTKTPLTKTKSIPWAY